MIGGDRLATAVFVLALATHVAVGLLLEGSALFPGDALIQDALEPLRSPTGVDVVAVLTDVGGSFATAAVLVAGAAAYAVRVRDRRDQAAALVTGLVVLVAAVSATKAAWGRARPEEALVLEDTPAYPSGHSAYAVTWVACALVTGKRPLVAAAAAVTMSVGATRLYLDVHFFSDVLGGLALGAAAFALRLRR